MDINALIPAVLAIPQSFFVFKILEIITFYFHFIFVNLLIGSTLIMLILNIVSRVKGQKSETATLIAEKLPLIFAFTINLGVAPYLFIQVIYGSFIYTSSILIGVFWLSVILSIIAAYSFVYIYRLNQGKFSDGTKVLISSIVFIMLIYTASVLTGNVNLMLEPDKWSVYFKNPHGTFFNIANPLLYTKMLHTVTGSVAVAGLFIAFLEKKKDDGKDLGIKIFITAGLLQIITGIILYYSVPENVIKSLSGSFYYILFSGALFAVVSFIFIYKRKLVAGVHFFAIVFFLMIIMKDMVRTSFLQMFFDADNFEVVKQNGPFLMFIAILIFCSVLMILVFRKVLKDKIEEKI